MVITSVDLSSIENALILHVSAEYRRGRSYSKTLLIRVNSQREV